MIADAATAAAAAAAALATNTFAAVVVDVLWQDDESIWYADTKKVDLE